MEIVIVDTFYTLTEAAARLGVERHTIWRWIKARKLPAQKAGGGVFIEKRIVDALCTGSPKPQRARNDEADSGRRRHEPAAR